MSIFGDWKSCVIAKDGTLSAEVDLGRDYEYLSIFFPTIDSAAISIKGSRTTGGTFQPVYITDPATGANVLPISTAGTGGINWIVPIGGFRYIKLLAGAGQTTAAVTFYVRGSRC